MSALILLAAIFCLSINGLTGKTAESEGSVNVDTPVSGFDPWTLEATQRARFLIRGEVGATRMIQYTDGMEDSLPWIDLKKLTLTESPHEFIDTDAAGKPRRFYRTVADGGGASAPVPEMVWIEPGTFTMGSPSEEQGHNANEGSLNANEGPLTEVTISRGFWLGKYEVTQGEFEALIGFNPSQFKGDTNLPVERLSIFNALAYCAALTEQERMAGRLPEGYEYDLPTEAQWEYACRAGTTTRFSFGDDPSYGQLGDYGWYTENGGFKTHLVGGKLPNPWGLYDMHGNVREWCWGSYWSYPGGSVTDPTSATPNSIWVDRGGGWLNFAVDCRSASRNLLPADPPSFNRGFRVALVQVP